MNTLQMIEAAKKDAFAKDNYLEGGYARFEGVLACFIPTASRSTLSKFKGRVIWKINGNRATKEEVKALIG